MPSETHATTLQDLYAEGSAKIRARFEQSGDGRAAIHDRSALMDSIIGELYGQFSAPAKQAGRFSIAAMGGYGRSALFPYSDIDILFLCEKLKDEELLRKTYISPLTQTLWDLHLRVSASTRTLAECGKLHRDNIEFNISLLDSRFVCGDASLFEQLRKQVLPGMVAREARPLMRELTGLALSRHEKYGKTIFHLEPNIKDGPGGLRDYQVACWLAQIGEAKRSGELKKTDDLLPPALRSDAANAVTFLDAVRCFLHYRQGRDLNGLTYELQSEAASAGIGLEGKPVTSPGDWMRGYFRHARAIDRLTVLFEEVPRSRFGLARLWGGRPRFSDADFMVTDGKIHLRHAGAVLDPEKIFRLFELVGQHDLKLSAETENAVTGALPKMKKWASTAPDLWDRFRPILLLPYAGASLRAMHRLGLLVLLFKEFQAIESLVVRDYYHRYTVDEHSLVTIDNLHRLEGGTTESEHRFRDILRSVERPELLYLALIFHDVGKGMPVEKHVEGSLQAIEGVLERLRLDSPARDTVTFLIGSHLRMSATVLRRDIFDPEAVRDFAQVVGTIEHLKMLTLFTYADIKAVNPEALTPWKAEMLWQLYAETENYLNRSVDDQRLYVAGEDARELEQKIHIGADPSEAEAFRRFLDGFPKRYLLTHSATDIAAHYRMFKRLGDSGAEISVIKRDEYYELALVAMDRPFLFAKVAGTIASWGMNILKAEASANQAGIILDTLRFSDRFHTLDRNPTEMARLKQDLNDAISGRLNVSDLMRRKFQPEKGSPKVQVESGIHLDLECSSHSTVVEIVTLDRPGLLYEISSSFAERGCNIEVALINTEGGVATDVFYITRKGSKLDPDNARELQNFLRAQL